MPKSAGYPFSKEGDELSGKGDELPGTTGDFQATGAAFGGGGEGFFEHSLEAGNSPQMIFRHYRELVTPQAAKARFGTMPEVAKARRETWEA